MTVSKRLAALRGGDSGAPNLARRRFLRRAGGVALAGVCGTGAYAGGWTPFHPRLERVAVTLAGLPASFDGFTIALLSDIHIQPGFGASRLGPALDLVRKANPDTVFLLGDYVNDQRDAKANRTFLMECVQALSVLTAPMGVFAIFGNHDYPDGPEDPHARLWEAAGVYTLMDDVAPLSRGGDKIWLAGLHSCIKRPTRLDETLKRAPRDAIRLVLWHEPGYAKAVATAGASLLLSGHTHGGQVVLPFVGPPVLPPRGAPYASGLYNVEGMPLYVTRGVGLLPPMVRVNCPPEVTLLTLRAA